MQMTNTNRKDQSSSAEAQRSASDHIGNVRPLQILLIFVVGSGRHLVGLLQVLTRLVPKKVSKEVDAWCSVWEFRNVSVRGVSHLLCPSLKPYFWTRMVLSFEHPFAFKHPLPFWKIASWTFRCSFLPPVLAPQEQAPVTLWMSQGMSKCIGCSICSIHVTHQSECENVILRRPFVCSISLYLHPNWSAKKCCRKSFQKSISSWGHHFHGKYAGNPKVSPGTFSPATCHNWFENDLEIATFFFFTVRNTSTSTLYTYFYDSTWCKLVLAPKAANSCKFHTNKTSRFVDLTVDTMAAVRIDVSWHCLICYV